MNTARYVVAIVVLLSMLPSILLWWAIHPFARFWRRLGARWTYTVLTAPTLALMWALWRLRGPLLGTDLGTSPVLLGVAGLAVAGAVWIGVKRRRHLTPKVLAGVPELSVKAYPGILLTEGVYARIRHPRYVEVTLAVLAYVTFANYSGGYALFAVGVLALYVVVLMEERELAERFGEAWEEYAARVPRFVPRWQKSVKRET